MHRIIFTTGYVAAIHNTAFLDRSTILSSLAKADGFPALDPKFQTNLPNLYVTARTAEFDFDPFFFGCTVGCTVAATIVGGAVVR